MSSTNNVRHSRVLDMVLIAFGAALIAICTWISIPTTVPFTLQTFAIALILGLLGGKRGTLSIVVFILLGLIGIPVFAGFKSGPGVLLGTTGGYIIGFLFMGLLYWLMTRFLGDKLWVVILSLLLGLVILYLFGTAWFIIIYLHNSGAIGLQVVLGWCVYPFIVPDLAKLTVAIMLARQLKRYVPA